MTTIATVTATKMTETMMARTTTESPRARKPKEFVEG